ncbi:DUF453-domain-containing protein [Crucibulum laeve]|uniref:DUF453-domain-containing protein n=1 Tax=Crucibulum laeve TaxID=68775 RepID=A0A5C3MIU5_9AGAR|nr:DUF453-domain-containing protein [Crucibulum laeve]
MEVGMVAEKYLQLKDTRSGIKNSKRMEALSAASLQSHLPYMLYLSSTPNPIPATFLRGGTSKGIFLNRSVLPAQQTQWDRIFLGIMGSPDPEHGRQLNGMGGGVSSLSKICVVSEPTAEQKAEGIDVEYTFVQVGIRDTSIDYSGNCGNLSSMIGVYALDEGICAPRDGTHATIRSFNTNTQKIIDTTFPLAEDGMPKLDLPEASVAGVPGKASQIILDFVNPGGARTGKLLPSGSPVTLLEIPLADGSTRTVHASLVDATNPTVFISHAELNEFLPVEDYIKGKQPAVEEVTRMLEVIRQQAAGEMGLDPSAQAQPKIALLSAPDVEDDGVDIVIHALSMGVLHKAIPMTVGLCLGVASKVEGTLAWDIVQRNQRVTKDLISIRHPGGVVDVGAEFAEGGSVKSAKVVRTGRRLMKGVVWW